MIEYKYNIQSLRKVFIVFIISTVTDLSNLEDILLSIPEEETEIIFLSEPLFHDKNNSQWFKSILKGLKDFNKNVFFVKNVEAPIIDFRVTWFLPKEQTDIVRFNADVIISQDAPISVLSKNRAFVKPVKDNLFLERVLKGLDKKMPIIWVYQNDFNSVYRDGNIVFIGMHSNNYVIV